MTTTTDLLRCDRYAAKFRAGIPAHGCMRRQLERQPGAKVGTLGPPRNEWCALRCALGQQHRAALVAAGVELGTCPRCGGALIGGSTCGACAERALEENRGPARGFLPPHERETSSRIWTGEAPDAPLGPPPGAPRPPPTIGLAPPAEHREPVRTVRVGGIALRREELEPDAVQTSPRPAPASIEDHQPEQAEKTAETPWPTAARPELSTSTPAPPAPVNPSPPARAEESPMACPECKSPTNHRSTCSRRPGGPAVKPAKPAALAPKPKLQSLGEVAAEARAREKAKAGRPAVAAGGDLSTLVDSLLARKAEHLEAAAGIDRQLDAIEQRIQRSRSGGQALASGA